MGNLFKTAIDNNPGFPKLRTPPLSVDLPANTARNVSAIVDKVYHQTAMAPALDDALSQLVRRRCRLQEIGIEVRSTPITVRPISQALLIPNLYSRADDLIPEESDAVLLALKRLPPKEAYDRVFRLRRAFQVGSLRAASRDLEAPIDTARSAPWLTSCSQKISKQRRKK